MIAATQALGWAYFCPICGVPLERFDFDKPAADYSCPFCCSQQRPSRVADRLGWESPD